jgi:hypothetical protein
MRKPKRVFQSGNQVFEAFIPNYPEPHEDDEYSTDYGREPESVSSIVGVIEKHLNRVSLVRKRSANRAGSSRA